MNQRPTGLNVSKALTGFLQYKSAEGLSPVTVSGYEHDLKLWIEYQGDMDVAEVETTHILAYLNYLRTDYVPRRITGNNDKKLSPKTVYNLYISVASHSPGRAGSFKSIIRSKVFRAHVYQRTRLWSHSRRRKLSCLSRLVISVRKQ